MNIDLWFKDLLERQSAKLPQRLRVEGLREAHLGPRCEYGRIVVEAEPAETFVLECSPELLAKGNEEYVRAAVMGVLDVVLTAGPYPLKDFILRIVEVHPHPIDSSSIAFRRAGRDAGRRLLEEAHLAMK